MFDTGDFDLELAEGPPSAASIAMLLGCAPASLDRDAAMAGAAGIERAQRLLAAAGALFTAAACGPAPSHGAVDEAAQEISAATGLHPQTAQVRVNTARSLAGRLPVTLAALAAAELSYRQAEQVERATRGLDAELAGAVEAAAVPGSPHRLTYRLARALARLAPGLVRRQAEQRRMARSVEYWSDPVEGIAGFAVQGPLAQVALIKAAIDRTAKPRPAGECRSIAARRFDVLHAWARDQLGLPGASSASRRGSARLPVHVTVPLATLLRLSDDPGELDGVGPIPAEVARELAADGEWRRWVTDETGRLLDVGARTYRPGAALDRYVRGRDRTCRFPTCRRPAVRCDLDHTLAFHTADGETVTTNLTALCRHHHRLKHETDWTYRTHPNGDVIWTAPSGRSYTAPAELHADDPVTSRYIAEGHRRNREKRERRERQAHQQCHTIERHPNADRDPWMTPDPEASATCAF